MHRTEYQFDNRDRQVKVFDANNTLLPEAQRKFTATTYDAVGNVLSIKDPVGNTTRYTYDGLNRLITDTNELNKTRTYGYDAAGNRVSMSDRNGRTTSYTYDGLNRQTAETWLNGSGNALRTITSTYDAVSQLKSISDPDSAYTFTYDLKGQLQTLDNQGTPGTPRVLLTYTYDANGNIVSVLDAINGTTAGTTAYTYDVLNRVTQVTQNGAGLQTKRVDFGYNPVGQFDSIRRCSDLNGIQLVADTRYSYDGLNRLQGLQHNRANGSTVASYTYGYDSSGRITSIASVFANSSYNDTTTYNYDNTSQLTGADHSAITDESYQYDANGNRSNYQTGSNNRLLSDGTYTYTYDDEGNLTQRVGNGATRTFVWDYRNRLTGMTDSVSGTTTYAYDVMNQRIAKTVGGQTTRFVYDRGNVYLEFSGNSSTPSTHYLYGPMVDQVLAQESTTAAPENKTTWMLTDHLGSIRDLVNNGGNVVNHFTYDSFGKVIGTMAGATVDTRYKYTGREFDAETGLHYYRARYYDASVGRFIGQDPIGFQAGDANLYGYVFNSPLDSTDPSGLLVRGIFNRGAGQLMLEDIGPGERKGRKITVKVFTGVDDARNNPAMEMVKTKGPIPSGRYAIVSNLDDTEPSHRGWYRLDAFDEQPFNDRHEPTGRDGFRLHPGYLSLGCITVDKNESGWQSSWNQVQNFLESTNKSTAFEQRSAKRRTTQIFTGAALTYYGDVWVDQKPVIPGTLEPQRPIRGIAP